jgi:hypothetical protein
MLNHQLILPIHKKTTAQIMRGGFKATHRNEVNFRLNHSLQIKIKHSFFKPQHEYLEQAPESGL